MLMMHRSLETGLTEGAVCQEETLPLASALLANAILKKKFMLGMRRLKAF